jgi:hypothetical protein
MEDKYVVYFKWNDEEKDSIVVDSYKALKLNCIYTIKNPNQELLGICKINQYGEYIEKDIPKSWYK